MTVIITLPNDSQFDTSFNLRNGISYELFNIKIVVIINISTNIMVINRFHYF